MSGCPFLLFFLLFGLAQCATLTPTEILTYGRCESWLGQPAVCAGIFPDSSRLVWDAPMLGINQSALDYIASTTWLPPLLQIPYDCAKMYLRLFCATTFNSCSNVPALGGAAVPHPPCQNVCQEANDACGTFWTLAGQLPINCSMLSPFTGSPQWPANGTYAFGCDPMPLALLGNVTYAAACPPGTRWVAPPEPSFTGLPCDVTPEEVKPPFQELILLNTGTCDEPWQGTPAACSGLLRGDVQGPVWTAPMIGLTQPFFEFSMNTPTSNDSDTTILSPILAMPLNCSTYYLRLFCGSAFQSCSNVSQIGKAVPHPPCRSVCRDANEACADFFIAAGVSPINCSMLSAVSGGPQWPEDGTYTFGCDPWPVQQMGETIYECPEPMQWLAPGADENTGAPCGLTCLNFSAIVLPTYATYSAGWTVYMIFSWISFFGGLYVAVTYLVFPDLRKFPHRLITPIAIGVLFMFAPQLGNSGMHLTNDNWFLCDDPLHISHYGGTSRWSAWSFHFGAWLIANYWLVQSISLFAFVVFGVTIDSWRSKEIFFHVVAWGMALGLSLAPLGIEGYGNPLMLPFVFFHPLSPEWENWVFWHAWVFLYLIQEFVTSGLSLIFMLTTKQKTKGWKREDQYRILLFAFIFFVTALASLSIQLKESTSDGVTKIENWYKCMYLGGNQTSCYDQLPLVESGLYWWGVLVFSWIGCDCFLLFGLLSPRGRSAWCTGAKNLADGKSFGDHSSSSSEEDVN